jgi:hypothetical protein
MSDASRTSEQGRLGFPEAAADAFDFLRADHGFRRTLVSDTAVRYESDRVFVNVFHDRPSLELGVDIGLIDDESRVEGLIRAAESQAVIGRPTGEYQFTLDEVVQLSRAGSQGGDSYSLFAGTREQVASQVPRLALGLKRHGAHLLRGESAEFERLAARRSEAAHAFTRGVELAQLRERVERAWRDGDLPSVARLLQEIGDEMTPAERKKLEYARGRTE